MMQGDGELDAQEIIDAIGRRTAFAEALLAGPKHKRDLRDELDVSNSTAYKALRELENLCIVERGENGYELTLTGRLVYEEYGQFCRTVECICRPGELLSFLPADTTIAAEILTDAEIVFRRRHAPNQPEYHFEEMIGDATVLKGTSAVALPHSVETFHRKVTDGELRAELVLERPVVEHLAADYPRQFGETVETDAVSIRVTDEQLTFGLVLVESPTERVGIVVYDPDGDLAGLIINDSQNAVEWGHCMWKQHVAGSTLLESNGSGSIEVDGISRDTAYSDT